jgi:electron transfer flavoprotein alpha subunit
MSVLVYIDSAEGHIKKSSIEALCYGAKIAGQAGKEATGILIGPVKDDLAALGKFGIRQVQQVSGNTSIPFDAEVYATVLAEAAKAGGAETIILSNNVNGKAIAPVLSVKLKAGLVTGAVSLPDTANGFVVKKNVFSGKAFANVSIQTPVKIIALNPNAWSVSAGEGTATVTAFNTTLPASRTKIIDTKKTAGEVPLTEADIVVSAGRGMKGPENWGMIEDLAKTLHAALACSRPVADAHWRPHNEHVGQTGIAIAPNLYIAIGISGAIQHLAGVNRSKIIVVINKDPEAPFFSAADYGIVGDAFEVVPKLSESIRKLKASA